MEGHKGMENKINAKLQLEKIDGGKHKLTIM